MLCIANYLSNDTFIINNGERIAQMIINKYEKCQWNIVEKLEILIDWGDLGHTGTK
jgi:dUTP pyrophosphatase